MRSVSPISRRFAPCLVVILACLAGAAHAQSVTDVYPIAPEDGASVGPRCLFHIGLDGPATGSDPDMSYKYRIVLSDDGFDTEAFVFDQVEDRNGWAYGGKYEDEPGVYYYTRKPLTDGDYEWRADWWNGIQWAEGTETFRLRVDTVAPADVEGLEMDVDRSRSRITIRWDDVYLDRDGNPEEVAVYHVYRYQAPGAAKHTFRTREIAVVDDTRFVDDDPWAFDTALVFYVIRAEDLAGNQTDKKPPRFRDWGNRDAEDNRVKDLLRRRD